MVIDIVKVESLVESGDLISVDGIGQTVLCARIKSFMSHTDNEECCSPILSMLSSADVKVFAGIDQVVIGDGLSFTAFPLAGLSIDNASKPYSPALKHARTISGMLRRGMLSSDDIYLTGVLTGKDYKVKKIVTDDSDEALNINTVTVEREGQEIVLPFPVVSSFYRVAYESQREFIPRFIKASEAFALLKKRHPQLFTKPYVPFELGMSERLFQKNPDIPLRDIRSAVVGVINHPLYLLNFLNPEIKNRVGVDGELTPLINAHRIHAHVRLRKVMRKKGGKYTKKLGKETVERITEAIKTFKPAAFECLDAA